MTHLENRLRATLRELADEARPAPLLDRLDRDHRHVVRRHRLALVAAAAAVATTLAAGSLVVMRLDRPSIVEPVERPPKVFRLSGTASMSPGRSLLAVTLTPVRQADDKPAYLLPAGGDDGVRLPDTTVVPRAWTQHLSADGTRYVRQQDAGAEPRLEIVDLRTGQSDDLGGTRGYCPELSPDNSRLAYYSNGAARVLDVRDRSSRSVHRVTLTLQFPCGGLAWSPDGELLAVRANTGTVLLDRDGKVVLRFPQQAVTNGSMSWSPDGRLILFYDRVSGSYALESVDGGPARTLVNPAAAIEPIGWLGRRIAWLTGPPGEQTLVATEQDGTDARTWMRFDVGDRQVEAVQWSRDLAGRAAD